VLPVIVAGSTYIAVWRHKRVLSACQDMNVSTSTRKDTHLRIVFSKFEKTFVAKRNYTAEQLRIIHTPLGFVQEQA
jgi:hypothetical protein